MRTSNLITNNITLLISSFSCVLFSSGAIDSSSGLQEGSTGKTVQDLRGKSKSGSGEGNHFKKVTLVKRILLNVWF